MLVNIRFTVLHIRALSCLVRFACFASFLCFVFACRERIDISTDNLEPKLAISCIITTDTGRCHAYVSRTLAYFGNDEATTYSATVKLNGKPMRSLPEAPEGYYFTDSSFYGAPGEDYHLEVWVDFDGDGEPEYYDAKATMPRMANLDSITLIPLSQAGIVYNDPPWMVVVHFQDEPGLDYYGANMYVNRTKYSFSYVNYYLNEFDATTEDGRYIRFPTYYINDEFRWYRDNNMILEPGDTISIELNCLSEDYYNFIRTASLEVSGGNPLFAGPPANVPGNISNGAAGILGVSTVSRKSLILPETEHFKKKKK